MVYNYPARYNDDGKNYPKTHIDYPTEDFFGRCGILPYYINTEGDVMFILGVNRDRIHQVCSFGGKSNIGEKWIDCSIREFNEESYKLLQNVSPFDVEHGIHLYSQKCILTILKLETICKYYSFNLVKTLADLRYTENMKSMKSDKWEILTFEEFSLDEISLLLKGEIVKGYELWNLDRVMLTQCWLQLVKML